MADTVVYDPSPAYAVLEFRHDSPESVGAGGVPATAEERQHDLVTTLEEAGLIHKVHNDTILDVAPATRCVPRGDPLFARTLLLMIEHVAHRILPVTIAPSIACPGSSPRVPSPRPLSCPKSAVRNSTSPSMATPRTPLDRRRS